MSNDAASTRGEVTVVLTGPDGEVKHSETFHNIITSVGNQLYAEAALATNTVTRPTTMHLGSGTTTAATTGAGAAIVTYISGSNGGTFTAPTTSGAGAGTSRRITYSCVWAAGTPAGTNTINEVALVNQSAATNAAASAANTIARAVLTTTVNKGTADQLTITWTHDIGS